MMTTEIRLPELGLVAATRVMLGVGIGLLIADKLSEPRRKRIGQSLLAVGVLSTFPLAIMLLGRRRRLSA